MEGGATSARLAVGVKEAAALSGLSHFTIAAKCRSGDLPSIRVGRRRLVSVRDLELWLLRHRTVKDDAGDAERGGDNAGEQAGGGGA